MDQDTTIECGGLAIDLVVSGISDVQMLPGDRLLVTFKKPTGRTALIRLIIPVEGLLGCRARVNQTLSEYALERICVDATSARPPAA